MTYRSAAAGTESRPRAGCTGRGLHGCLRRCAQRCTGRCTGGVNPPSAIPRVRPGQTPWASRATAPTPLPPRSRGRGCSPCPWLSRPEVGTPDVPRSWRRPSRGPVSRTAGELTTAGQSVRAPNSPGHSPRRPTSHRGYSPRLGGTHHATHHRVVSGPGHRLRWPGSVPRSAGFSHWPYPAVRSGRSRGCKGGCGEGCTGGCEGGCTAGCTEGCARPGRPLPFTQVRPWFRCGE